MTRSLTARLYVGGVIAAGTILLVALGPRALHRPATVAALIAAALGLSVIKVRLPLSAGSATLSPAHAVDFLALILEGAGVAMFVGAIGVLAQCTVRVRHRQPAHRAVFSAATVIVGVQVAGWCWRALGGSVAEPTVLGTMIPLAVAALAYYGVNTSLIVGAIAVTTAVPPLRAWDRSFWWCAPAYVAAAIVAAAVAFALLHPPAVELAAAVQ